MKSPVAAALAGALIAFIVTAPPAVAADRQPAMKVLDSLPVSAEMQTGYDRDLFRHWVDADDDGCDTREEVLIAERRKGKVVGCDVVGGQWRSMYDGIVTTDPRTFDIDHRVPLAEAWGSGAWRWDARTRETYANDLGFASSLLAVTAASNRSKSDRDPTDWMPPLASQRCTYAKSWIAVKFRWRLAVDTSEKSTLRRLLAGCSPDMSVPARAAIATDEVAIATG